MVREYTDLSSFREISHYIVSSNNGKYLGCDTKEEAYSVGLDRFGEGQFWVDKYTFDIGEDHGWALTSL